MRVGILGGTFDPPHVGHLLIAADALDALELDRIVYVPTGVQPLKRDEVVAAPGDRLEMTRLLAGDDGRLGVDPIEVERPGLSFTVDTLREMARRAPGDERVLLMGADVAWTVPRWREPEAVRALAEVVVLRRGGEPAPEGFRLIPSRRVEVSSTEIRTRVRAGRSIRGFVPDAVRAFIERTGLYRD
jgi:nicotinate-nucleotide adenylyltransferase